MESETALIKAHLLHSDVNDVRGIPILGSALWNIVYSFVVKMALLMTHMDRDTYLYRELFSSSLGTITTSFNVKQTYSMFLPKRSPLLQN